MVAPSPIETATRKSIAKYSPLGSILSRGQENPITLHVVDDDLFRSLWALVAEVMVVDGALCRYTKENIAQLVSKKNECPVCVTAHSMMGSAAEHAATRYEEYEQALVYSETVQDATVLQKKDILASARATSPLTSQAMAEAALVVLLFQHMNRVVSAIMGEEMSTAMLSVPRKVARTMESPGVMKYMNRAMSWFIASRVRAHEEPGISVPLFEIRRSKRSSKTNANNSQDYSSSNNDYSNSSSNNINDDPDSLPSHLAGATVAGPERAKALNRLVQLVDILYETRQLKDDVSPQVIRFLQDPANTPPCVGGSNCNSRTINWILIHMRTKAEQVLVVDGDDEPEGAVLQEQAPPRTSTKEKTTRRSSSSSEKKKKTSPPKSLSAATRSQINVQVAIVLLMVTHAPKVVYRNSEWFALTKAIGKDRARLIVLWWSLRLTLQMAKGLDAKDLLARSSARSSSSTSNSSSGNSSRESGNNNAAPNGENASNE